MVGSKESAETVVVEIEDEGKARLKSRDWMRVKEGVNKEIKFEFASRMRGEWEGRVANINVSCPELGEGIATELTFSLRRVVTISPH